MSRKSSILGAGNPAQPFRQDFNYVYDNFLSSHTRSGLRPTGPPYGGVQTSNSSSHCCFGDPYSAISNSAHLNSGRASFRRNSQPFNSIKLTLIPARASFRRNSQLFNSINLTLIPAHVSFSGPVAILASAVWGSCTCTGFAGVAGFQHHGRFAGGPGSQAREEGKQHHQASFPRSPPPL